MRFFKRLLLKRTPKPSSHSTRKRTRQIKALKRAIQQFGARPAVSVKASNTGLPILSSHLLGLAETEERYGIILDALRPETANDAIDVNSPVLLILQKKGITVSFSVTIIEKQLKGDTPLYLTSLPSKIETEQLRKNYRAPVSKFRNIPVIINSAEHCNVKGRLENISQKGAGILISSSLREPFYPNEIITRLKISLPGEQAVQCQAVVKQFRKLIGTKKLLGIRFSSFSGDGESAIHKLLMDCQRHECEAKH